MFEYILGRPWYDAKKVSGYSRLFTKGFLRVMAKKQSDAVKEECGGKYDDGICGFDYNPITCAQDYSDSGYLYRTVEDDGRKAKIMYIWTGSAIRLGNLYKYGRGVQQDSAEAETLFRSAANRGHQGAQLEVENLGRR
jgi:hypothetical protein